MFYFALFISFIIIRTAITKGMHTYVCKFIYTICFDTMLTNNRGKPSWCYVVKHIAWVHNSLNSCSHLVLTGEYRTLNQFLCTLIKFEHHCNFVESQGAFYTIVTPLNSNLWLIVSTRQNYLKKSLRLLSHATFMCVWFLPYCTKDHKLRHSSHEWNELDYWPK